VDEGFEEFAEQDLVEFQTKIDRNKIIQASRISDQILFFN
jgi:hypothetical protein